MWRPTLTIALGAAGPQLINLCSQDAILMSKPSNPAAAAAKSLQLCPTLCDLRDGSPPGSLSLGFSRQDHWSGFRFPSMHESEKWKGSRSVVSDSSRPHGLQPTWFLCPRDLPGKNTGVGCHFLLQCIESEKWKWSRSVVSDSSRPHGLAAHQAPPSTGHLMDHFIHLNILLND